MAPHSSTLALGNPMDRGACQAAVHGVAKSRTRLSDFTFTFHFHALEKEMATHSSVLAWRIPGMGEHGGLPSMGSHKVGHDRSDLVVVVELELGYRRLSSHLIYLIPSDSLFQDVWQIKSPRPRVTGVYSQSEQHSQKEKPYKRLLLQVLVPSFKYGILSYLLKFQKLFFCSSTKFPLKLVKEFLCLIN